MKYNKHKVQSLYKGQHNKCLMRARELSRPQMNVIKYQEVDQLCILLNQSSAALRHNFQTRAIELLTQHFPLTSSCDYGNRCTPTLRLM